MTPSESPSSLLERAAEKIEELAFGFGAQEFWTRETRMADLSAGGANWAERFGPAVAPPLAAWLRHTAEEGGQVQNYYLYVRAAQDALTFARLILGEPVPGEDGG